MTDHPERRQTDSYAEAIGKLSQKLDDHIEQNNRDFSALDKRLDPITEFYDRAKFPVRVLVWTLVTLLIGIMAAIGNWIFEGLRKHIH